MTYRGKLVRGVLIAAALGVGLDVALGGACAWAVTYDATASFSLTRNTDSAMWSYRYNTTGVRDGQYTLLPGTASWTGWKAGRNTITLVQWAVPGAHPSLGVNKRAVALVWPTPGDIITVPPHAMIASTGDDGGDLVLSFRAPAAGTVTVAYSFAGIEPSCGDGVRWYVDRNATDLASGAVSNSSSTGVQTLSVAVQKADRLNFIIDRNSNYYCDDVAMTATVTY